MAKKNKKSKVEKHVKEKAGWPVDIPGAILKALDRSWDGIVIGSQYKIFYCNKAWARIHRWPRDFNPLGKSLFEIEREELKPILDSVISELDKRGHFTGTFEIMSPRGDLRQFHLKVNNLKKLTPPITIGILREITDLHKARKEIETRNKELSALNEILSLVSTASDLKSVAKKILDVLGSFIGACAGGLYEVEGASGKMTIIESFGLSRKILRHVRTMTVEDSAFSKILRSKRSIILEEDMPGYRGGAQDIREEMGFKQVVGLCMKSASGRRYISIFATRKIDSLDPRTIRFLDRSAAQLAAALDRIEILERLQDREKEIVKKERLLETFSSINDCISSSNDRSKVLRGLLRIVKNRLRADYATINRLDSSLGYAELLEQVGLPDREAKKIRFVPMSKKLCKGFMAMVESKSALVIEESMSGYRGGSMDLRKLLKIKTTAGVVIPTTASTINYLLVVGFKKAVVVGFEEKTFLEQAAKRISLAIERLDNIARLSERERELRDLYARLIEADEEAKRRCAIRLHDDLGQEIAALGMELSSLDKIKMSDKASRAVLSKARSRISSISSSIRGLSRSLHPPALEELGLAEALDWYTSEWGKENSIRVRTLFAGLDRNLPHRVAIAIYRIVQECLENVRRHSGASMVTIKVTKGNEEVILNVTDNGKGLSESIAKSSCRGLGLRSIRERAEELKGIFRIESQAGKGVKIHVRIPV